MRTYFDEADLVSFGNYLLSDKRRKLFEQTYEIGIKAGMNPMPVEDTTKMVFDTDIANWTEKRKRETLSN